MPEITTREISVPVTAAHIERGQNLTNQGSWSSPWLRSKTCAVALALTDALGYPCSCSHVDVHVAGPVYVAGDPQLPNTATRFITEADRQYDRLRNGLEPGGTPLEPFTFTILVADGA